MIEERGGRSFGSVETMVNTKHQVAGASRNKIDLGNNRTLASRIISYDPNHGANLASLCITVTHLIKSAAATPLFQLLPVGA